MEKASIIYEEVTTLIAKYYHPKSGDYLEYQSKIQIKERGKMPVVMTLNFTGILPFAAPMPPEEHMIKAPSILELYSKLQRWFKKYGYVLT